MKYLEYKYNHDRYKKIAVEDYKKLPQDTKKQKKYYKSAKNRDRRVKKRRLMNLFEQLERENSDYRQLSIVGMEV